MIFYDDELYGTLRFRIDDGIEILDYGQIQRIDLATGATRNIGPVGVGADSKALILDSVPEVLEWTVDSGPGVVTFADAEDPTTSATFSTPGAYVLRLTAYDSPVVFDTVTVTASHTCNDGIDNDGDGRLDFDGGLSALGVDAPSPLVPDLGCFSDPIRDSEVRQACGLGADLVVVLPIWVFFRKRRSQRAAAAA